MPRYHNPNNHPVVVSITEPRISVTVFPAAWAPNRLPVGARQVIELDEILARVFIRIGMLRRSADPTPTPLPVAAPVTASLQAAAPPSTGTAQTTTALVVETPAPPLDTVIPAAAEPEEVIVPESPVAVTEEDVAPSDLALRATTETGRIQLRNRPPSPPRKRRYNL